LLNLSPNHLDRYPGMPEYRAAKLRIFENQTADDVMVVNASAELPSLPAKRITFSATSPAADFTLRGREIFFQGRRLLDQSDTLLPGVHNAENIMAALGMGLGLNLDLDNLVQAIANHAPPVHRCEFVRDLEGVRWINDSKATNLDAMEKAILSQDRPIILIAGGKDKGVEFDDNAMLVREKARAAVLIGEMRHRIASSWKDTECQTAESLEEAVNKAHSLAQAGDVVLFSPGTSSYDMFRNYGERGNIFKSLVQKLKNNPNNTP
jgi:UDP-N-acetylmuramoylalanine--D-glutamate ligase